MSHQLLEKYNVQVTRSRRRKTLCLKVVEGQVKVNVPTYVPLREIAQFVDEKSAWLDEQLTKQAEVILLKQRRFEHGSTLPYWGEQLTLEHQHHAKKPCLVDDKLWVPANKTPEQYRRAIETWYRAQMLAYVTHRVAYFAELMDLSPAQVKVRYYKSRWGSCSHKGALQFNWLLVMAPQAVVDYVIVHELAHLTHFNHSQAFWCLVAQHCPDYKTHRMWLKNQMLLHW